MALVLGCAKLVGLDELREEPEPDSDGVMQPPTDGATASAGAGGSLGQTQNGGGPSTPGVGSVDPGGALPSDSLPPDSMPASSNTGVPVAGSNLVTILVEGVGTVTSGPTGARCVDSCSSPFTANTLLRARTENLQESFFTGWSSDDPDADCNGPKIDCNATGPGTVTAHFAPMEHNLIFASSVPYASDLGGLAAYDAACNALATTVGINNPSGDGYVAAMSDQADATVPVGNIVERLGAARGWVRRDGLPVGDDIASLFGLTRYYPPAITEQGYFTSGSALFTGFDPDYFGEDHCGRWTSQVGTVGAGYASSNHWAGDGNGHVGCETYGLPIFCMGTTHQTPLGDVQPFTGKRIWVTNTPYVPGSMTPDAKCVAERPAGVEQAVAFVAYSSRPASSVSDPAATYVLADGRLVGTGRQLVAFEGLGAGPWLLADGTAIGEMYLPVWTGSARTNGLGAPAAQVASATTTCADWTSASPVDVAFVGMPGAADWTSWEAVNITGGQNACSSVTTRLYCVEP